MLLFASEWLLGTFRICKFLIYKMLLGMKKSVHSLTAYVSLSVDEIKFSVYKLSRQL